MPDQLRFLETLRESSNKLNILNEERHIQADLNLNLFENGTFFREENKNIVKDTNKISSEAKKYLEFCKIFGFNQSNKQNNLPY